MSCFSVPRRTCSRGAGGRARPTLADSLASACAVARAVSLRAPSSPAVRPNAMVGEPFRTKMAARVRRPSSFACSRQVSAAQFRTSCPRPVGSGACARTCHVTAVPFEEQSSFLIALPGGAMSRRSFRLEGRAFTTEAQLMPKSFTIISAASKIGTGDKRAVRYASSAAGATSFVSKDTRRRAFSMSSCS